MNFYHRYVLYLLSFPFLVAPATALIAEEPTSSSEMNDTLVERLYKEAGPAVVVITVEGRDGNQHGIGTGFFIRKDGLIATNLHVIGQSRPIKVKTSNGKELKVESVYASDATLDLAILKVSIDAAPALQIADLKDVNKGEPIIVIGNPQGLQHSVVSGVLSGTRKIDSRDMLQLAIPIEPGNSGGPVLNADGEVIGIVTMKSAVTENLGFAVKADHLQPLLDSPNSVPMSRWLTIGSLNPNRWETLFGANWKQRAGRIVVNQMGSGFGGRSLCLATQTMDSDQYEIATLVKLNEIDGAAGLAFLSNGSQKHFGFYISSGRLRITRFDGSSVYQWNVLKELDHEQLKPDGWNAIKVRVSNNKFTCLFNDEIVFQGTFDAKQFPATNQFGLVKFRHTSAEFKNFNYGKKLDANNAPDEKQLKELTSIIEKLPDLTELKEENVIKLSSSVDLAADLLAKKLAALNKEASALEELRTDIRTKATILKLKEEISQPEQKIDLIKAALLLAQLDDHELSIEPYLDQVASMSEEIKNTLPKKASEQKRLQTLLDYLFQQNGYHGSRTEYYHRANSYISRVLEDREGLPITLSVLVMSLGEKLDLNIEGVGLPGHFIVRYKPKKGEEQLVDVFEQGKLISKKDAESIVANHAGIALEEEHLEAVPKNLILQRMLMNLLALAKEEKEYQAMLRYYEALVTLDPTSAQYRGMYALLLHEGDRDAQAMEQLKHLETNHAAEVGATRLRQMREFFSQ